MQIESQINQLIKNLNELKPTLSESASDNKFKFNKVLEASMLSSADEATNIQTATIDAPVQNADTENPVEVDTSRDSVFSKRKPDMRELMEKIASKSVAEIYSGSTSEWTRISQMSSDLLYGVLGGRSDRRDWAKIMESDNLNSLLDAAVEENGKIDEPMFDFAQRYNLFQDDQNKNTASEKINPNNDTDDFDKTYLEKVESELKPTVQINETREQNPAMSISQLISSTDEVAAESRSAVPTLEALALNSTIPNIVSSINATSLDNLLADT